jgi:hypothetical protein
MTRSELMQQTMRGLVGLPYRWGGDDPINGFDCSGGVMEILKTVGVCGEREDFTSASMARKWPKVISDTLNADTGDLICMASPSSPDKITHVVMVYAQSPKYRDPWCFEFGGGGSKTTTLEAAASANAYGRIRPLSSILARGKTVAAVVRPAPQEVQP